MILIGSLCAFCMSSTHKICFSFVTIVLHCASTYKVCFSFVAIVPCNICFLFLICPIKITLVLKRRKLRIVIAFVEKTPSEGGFIPFSLLPKLSMCGYIRTFRTYIKCMEQQLKQGGGVMKLSPITLSSILICLSIDGLKNLFVTHSNLLKYWLQIILKVSIPKVF